MATEITEATIRKVAEQIHRRDGIPMPAAMQKAAEWAANKMLAANKPANFNPGVKVEPTKPGRHPPSVRCPCESCKAWMQNIRTRSQRANKAYNGSSGCW